MSYLVSPYAAIDEGDSTLIVAAARVLGATLLAHGLRVSTVESCTGGGIAQAITAVAGSSAWFDMGWVTYSNAAKTQLVGVPAVLIAEQGAVSEAVVRAMAEGARMASGAPWAVAVSGVAGPSGGSTERPVGLVWMAWAGPRGTVVERNFWPSSRALVRCQTVYRALSQLNTLVLSSAGHDPVP
ncbi:MAG: CinA family protein [Paraperlucidibaca sp.]